MKIFYLILIFLIISCKSTQGIQNAVLKINKCYEGSNQTNVDTKAIYDEKNKILIFYIGYDAKRSINKWEIPIEKIDSENIFFENEKFPYVKIKTTRNLDIKYYENNKLNDSLNQFAYPIYDYCFKKNEINQLIKDLQKETN